MAGIIFCIPIYKLFDMAYNVGGDKLPAPAAHAWKAVAVILSKGDCDSTCFICLPLIQDYMIYQKAFNGEF